MYSFRYLVVTLVSLILCFSIQSCGGDVDDELLIPEIFLSINDVEQKVTAFSALSSDSQIASDDIRFVDIFITTEEGDLQLGVQNINDLEVGLCLKQRTYKFMPDSEDCISTQTTEYCQQAYADFNKFSDNTTWSSFLNSGEIKITSCSTEDLLTGSFTGRIQKTGWPESVTIDGTFENLKVKL